MNITFSLRSCICVSVFLLGTLSLYAAPADDIVLARVDGLSSSMKTELPVYEFLKDAGGTDYALVIAPESHLELSRLSYKILDRQADKHVYIIAMRMPVPVKKPLPETVPVLYADGAYIITYAEHVETVSTYGYSSKQLTTPVRFRQKTYDTPLIRQRPADGRQLLQLDYNAMINDIINGVTQSNVYDMLAGLSGEKQVMIGGSMYTIASRHTRDGSPFMKDTQYAYELFQGLGLNVAYQQWVNGSYSNRNVIAEKPGQLHPDEILLITAHIDNQPSGPRASGADDNGSGSIGVILAAQIFNQYTFDRTIRYVLFTGEEQGLLGSGAYADSVFNNGDDIVAVYNMDMLAWDNTGPPIVDIHTRRTDQVGYSNDLEIANVFIDIVNTYSLSNSITPEIVPDAIWASDHSQFWNKGYPAVLAIEDWDDFNAYYHTTNDALRNINLPYCTSFIQGSLGTCAQIGGVYLPEATILPILALAGWYALRRKR